MINFLRHFATISSKNFVSRRYRAWDFNSQVGLVLAGSSAPGSNTVEISENGGLTFRQLADIPYANKLSGACVVIIDYETVFIAGGIRSMEDNYFALP